MNGEGHINVTENGDVKEKQKIRQSKWASG